MVFAAIMKGGENYVSIGRKIKTDRQLYQNKVKTQLRQIIESEMIVNAFTLRDTEN